MTDRMAIHEHPRPPAYDAAYEAVKAEVARLHNKRMSAMVASDELFDVLVAAFWLVDHAYSRGCCGDTEARTGDIEDLCAAVEACREAAK